MITPLIPLRLTALAVMLLTACSRDQAGAPSAPQLDQAVHETMDRSAWSVPVHVEAPISSPARELGALLSRDELSLYFGSDRPGGLGAFDIWASRRACLECPWGEPVNLGPNINSAGGDGGPFLSVSGHLLFFSGARTGGEGGEDIWVSRRTHTHDDLGWEPAINLGPLVNTPEQENGPVLLLAAGGGPELYFGRSGEIYRARATPNGMPLEMATPVVELNDPSVVDGEVTIRRDGRELFFRSNRTAGSTGMADIWVSTRNSVREPWSAPVSLGAPVNSAFADLTPTLSWSGTTLLFSGAAARGSSLGFQDVWMTTREEWTARHP